MADRSSSGTPFGGFHIGCACHQPGVARMTNRMNADLSRRGFLACVGGTVTALGLPDMARAQVAPKPAATPPQVLLSNVRLFDGVSLTLRDGVSVLVEGARIAAIDATRATPPAGARVIDCGGRVLMPGMIDAHWHTMMAALPLPVLLTADIGYLHLAASTEAERTLQRGFTTVRDAGGPSFALKRAIDEGMISGPRIFPSGAMISQTAGHGDFRFRYEVPRTDNSLTRSEAAGASTIADSPDEVRRRTREQLMLGASQIKLMAGGGAASLYDPLDAIQYRPEELRAAVEAAEDWGTYVMTHVYMPLGIRRAVAAGVRCIEHGQLTDEDTVRTMVDAGVYWSLQPFLAESAGGTNQDPVVLNKLAQVREGTDTAYRLAIKHKARIGWGSDILFSPGDTDRQATLVTDMRRWFTPAQTLRQITSENAAILALSGARAPYDGRLGVVEKGAFADLLVVDGDPTQDLAVLGDPARNLRVLMKDGRIHKNTL